MLEFLEFVYRILYFFFQVLSFEIGKIEFIDKILSDDKRQYPGRFLLEAFIRVLKKVFDTAFESAECR